MRARALVVAAFREALVKLDLSERVEAATRSLLGEVAPGDVSVIAAGKASAHMFSGARRAFGGEIARGFLVLPDGTECPPELTVRALRASHPLPDARSVAAGERAIELASSAHTLFVLLSGGASALLSAPRGITLDEKRALTTALLRSGATIGELNTLRRHLSRIKGGGLLRGAASRVITFYASDVIDGAPHEIASGPSVPDPTTIADAAHVLAEHAPQFASLALSETVKPTDPEAKLAITREILGPPDLARAVAAELARRGFTPRLAAAASRDVGWFVVDYVRALEKLAPGEALVRAAEPTVSVDVDSPGRGGRSSHLAAAVARALPAGYVFLAGASDGVDGASGAGGAAIDASFSGRISPERIGAALAAFDTAPLHEEADTAITSGPTGHNLADVHVLLRER